MQWTRWCSIVVFSGGVSVALGACGGDARDERGEGALDTGIDADKPLGEVTDAEAVQACNRLGAALEQRLPGDFITSQACTLFGVGESTPGACRAARDECAEDAGETDVYDPSQCEGSTAGELEGCTVTVGELEACTDEYTNELKDLLERVSCDNAGTPRAGDVTVLTFLAYRLPASCTSVQERCPNAPIFDVAGALGGL